MVIVKRGIQMKIQKTYSAEEFANEVGEKVANIRAFRTFAREFGLIQNHELLTEDFVPAWEIAAKLHYEKGVKWEFAMKYGLSNVFGITEELNTIKSEVSNSSIEEKLDQVIFYLKKIAVTLENRA